MKASEILERYDHKDTLTVSALLRLLMVKRNYTYALIGEKLGVAAQTVNQQVIKTKDISLSRFARILDALDCDIIIRSRTKGHEEWNVTAAEDSWQYPYKG